MKEPIISAQNITVGYDDTLNILEEVSFDIYSAEFVGVIGPNGGGKTTLVKTLLGLLQPRKGEIVFPKGRVEVGYVSQQNSIDKSFPISVEEVVLSGLIKTKRPGGTSKSRERVQNTLDLVGIAHYKKQPIGALSGGELQRVLLARALVSNPDLLILDEPNTYVDKGFENRLYELLPEINKTTAIIMVSHDLGIVSRLVERLFCVNRGLHIHKDIATICNVCSNANGMPYLQLAGHSKW